MESLANKPFAMVGVNSDKDREVIKRTAKLKRVPWRSFWDGEQGANGPITKAWNVRAFPTIFVLDAQGTIRYKFIPGSVSLLDKPISTLLAELK
jgi:hypothetical protein